MIQPPRRSVTRFFIPMIDVLTLLFCIFLLMPFVKSAGDEGVDGGPAIAPEVIADPADVLRRLQEAEKEIDRLRKERGDIASRMEIRTLEIDKETGELLYYDPQPMKLTSKDDATRLIARHREEARKAGGRELYYLFLFPRDPESAGLPRRAQEQAYKQWFKDVPFGIDNPRARGGASGGAAMSATPLLFADVADQFGRTVINIFAVAGAAAVGYMLTFVIIWSVGRFVIHKQLPMWMTKVLSAVAAIAAGAAVAMMLFSGSGGFGLGFGFGGGTNAPQGGTAKVGTPTQPASPKTTPTNTDSTQVAAPMRVKVLGGKIPSKKFYVVGNESDAGDLASLEGTIRDRIGKKPAVRELIIVLKDADSAGYDSQAVKDLDAAAKRFGLSVGYDPPPEPLK